MKTPGLEQSPSHRRPQVSFFLPHLGGGGTEKMVVTLANAVLARGYDVDMVLVRGEGVYRSMLAEGVRVVDLKASNAYVALPALTGYLRRQEPQVLVSALELTNFIAIISRWISGAKSRIAIRIENMISVQQRAPWKKRLEKMLASWLYPSANRIIAVSSAVAWDAASYIGVPRSRIDVIYNPVLSDNKSARAVRTEVHPWFAEGAPPVILGVGRLTAQKDFSTLLKAFALVRQQRDVRLIILGEGEQRSGLLALAGDLHIAEDLEMSGFARNAEYYMQNSSVFVLSSIYEGLPTVLIEALAAGCAVVSTDCPGGSREILHDGLYGALVPVRDEAAMAKAICSMLDGERKTVDPAWLNQFKVDAVVEQNLKVLELSAST